MAASSPAAPERRIVIGHHVRHWTRGGETELHNLIELCAYHHRCVHEGTWTVAFDGIREVTFFRPDGTPVSSGCSATGSAEPFAADLEPDLAEHGVNITAFELTLKHARSRGGAGSPHGFSP